VNWEKSEVSVAEPGADFEFFAQLLEVRVEISAIEYLKKKKKKK